MKWLRTFLGLCVHEWEIYETCTMRYAGVVSGKIYIQKCKKCGKLHNHEVDVGV